MIMTWTLKMTTVIKILSLKYEGNRSKWNRKEFSMQKTVGNKYLETAVYCFWKVMLGILMYAFFIGKELNYWKNMMVKT